MQANPVPNAGNDLIRLHKVITRALSVSLQNSKQPELAGNLQQGFLTYVKALTIMLHAHHEGEDEISFPYWRTRFPEGPFEKLVEQHRQMMTDLEQIEDWLGKSANEWRDENLLPLYDLLAELQTHWHTHITLEEETMGPDNSLKYLSNDENIELAKRLAEHGQEHSKPPEIVMPFVVYNMDETDRNEFVKLLPPVVIQQLIPVAWKSAWEPMTPFLLT